MNSRETLELEIEQLKAQLKPRKAALAALNRFEALSEGLADSPATRFYNVRPLVAIRTVLEEHGNPMPKVDLQKILMDGGVAIGKKRAASNVEVGIRIALKVGSLTVAGKEELLGLPEWNTKK
jgi:ribosomal protein L29